MGYEGTEVKFKYLKSRNESITLEKIKQFKETLRFDLYKNDDGILYKLFHFFGLRAFVNIGMVWRQDFIRCFSYYSDVYAAEWAGKETESQSIIVGAYNVFERMLFGKGIRDGSRLCFNKKANKENRLFFEIANNSIRDYWKPHLLNAIRNVSSLEPMCNKLGDGHVSRYLMDMKENTEKYLRLIAQSFTNQRELVSMKKINDFVFGADSRTNFNGCDPAFFELLKGIAEEEFETQKRRFVAENQTAMDVSKDQWTLYAWHGASLRYRKIDFREIHCKSMRAELKYFLKHRFSGAVRINDHCHTNIIRAVNILCKNNPSIHCFADIDSIDVKVLHTTLENCGEVIQSSIMLIFFACRAVMDFLMSDERNLAIKAPRPHRNSFKDIVFVNAKKYSKNTPYIPGRVLSQIVEHLNELPEEDRLVFQIFMETGMRAKEVAFLEYGCLERARYEGRVKLKYIPHKSLTARRRAGLEDYYFVYISEELAQKIRVQSNKTKRLREKYDLPYIFLYEYSWSKIPVFNTTYFVVRLNDLIEQHSICDADSNLWHFTSRQCRKTLAVTMIENGATAEELTYQFGHLDASTVTKYYIEVKAMKLAELNSKFFREQFNILLSQETLFEYTEEERRQLYVDFRLGRRRVELGFCAKNCPTEFVRVVVNVITVWDASNYVLACSIFLIGMICSHPRPM